MADRPSNDAGVWRDPALDLLRGVAVLMMVWVHFVPEPAEGAESLLAELQRVSVLWLDGLPAALFLLLVGASAAAAKPARAVYVWRRAVGLAAIGVVFWVFVWPNDILVPIAMMMLLVNGLRRLGRAAIVAVVIGVLMCVPVATWLWGDYAWTDVREDGTHLANHGWGWFTVRYFLINGAYPLLPWSVLPLLGFLLFGIRHQVRALRITVAAAVASVVLALLISQLWGDEYAGGLAAHLDVTWQPTSLPFVGLWGGAAVAILAGSMLCLPRARTVTRGAAVAAVGRASLTHYLLHLVVVYSALRVWWPAEDWPTAVGAAAACGYIAFALLVTPRWLRGGHKAPVEALLARCSGR